MPEPFFTDLAREELGAAWDYLAQYSLTAADRFYEQFWQRARLHVQFPKMGRARDDLRPGLRSFVVDRHIGFYEIIGDTIHIARVLHGSRDLEAAFAEAEPD